MAEAIARHALDQPELASLGEVFVASAGVAASNGSPVSSETIAALDAMGIDHEGSSTALNANMVEKADAVFCMTRSHFRAVREMVGVDSASAEKVQMLDPTGDIDDPIGLGQSAYTELAEKLSQLIPIRLKEVLRS